MGNVLKHVNKEKAKTEIVQFYLYSSAQSEVSEETPCNVCIFMNMYLKVLSQFEELGKKSDGLL